MSDLNSSIPAGSRAIPGIPGYRVCDGGDVFSSRRCRNLPVWHIVKPRKPRKYGHIQIEFQVDGKRVVRELHTLVLEAFVGPCPPGMEGCHNDGNPGNNFAYNLRWDTHKNNQADMARHGRSIRGERSPFAILKESDIPDIFRQYSLGFTQSEIAEIRGINKGTIESVLQRKSWPHVEIPAEYLPGPHRHLESVAKGERHGMATLRETAVIEIFRLRSEGMSGKEIAERVGTSYGNIMRIITRKTWSHVPIPAEYLPCPRTT
jgi:DNA-binding CsgD family transcriptional regulator